MNGQYAHNIDAKGRLFIPTKLRDELGGTLHVTIGQDHCLSALLRRGAGPGSTKV
ncbi:MAG: MraZ N-terminal domain-containing protein [Oscillospiraceae bacterium]